MQKGMMLLLMISLVFCAACGNDNVSLADAGETTLGINRDGTVEEVTIEPFEAEYYSETELEAYIQAAVDTFNDKNPQPVPETTGSGKGEPAEPPKAVTVLEVKAEHGKARMHLLYQSADIYNAFNEMDLQVMTIEDAVASGVFSGLHTVRMAGDKGEAAVDEVMQKEGLYLVITQHRHRLVTAGKLVYYTENVTEEDSHTVVTAEDEPSYILFKMK